MNYISRLNYYKIGVKENLFDEITLRTIETYFEYRWKNIDVNSNKLVKIINDQQDLMFEVQKIQRNEYSFILSKDLKNTLSFKKIIEKTSTICRANRIYILPKCDKEKVIIIGDIHSDPISIKSILEACNFYKMISHKEPIRLIFMGDYVDRGKEHLKTIDLILLLKYVFPNNIYLLRGNHDGGFIENNGQVKTPYKVPEDEDKNDYFPLYLKNLEKNNPNIIEPFISDYFNFFNSLAIIAVFKANEKIHLTCHAGIPRPSTTKQTHYEYIKCLSDLTNDQILDSIDKSIVQNIIWSDPIEDEQADLHLNLGRFKYTKQDFETYKNYIDIDKFYRGHQVQENGIKEYFESNLISVYSTGDNMMYVKNTSSAYKGVTPKVVSISNGNTNYLRI